MRTVCLFILYKELDLNIIDWTAVSSVASLLMVIATFIALWQSRKQISEMKRQWNEERKARLVLNFISYHDWVVLQITNIGKEPAYNIKANFNSDFLNRIFIEKYREEIVSHQNQTFYLEPKGCYNILITSVNRNHLNSLLDYKCDKDELDILMSDLAKEPLFLELSYNNSIYKERMVLNDFFGSIIIEDPIVENISSLNQSLKELTDTLKKKIE